MGLFASRHWREFSPFYLILLHILFIFPSSFHFKSQGTKMIILGLPTSLLLPPVFFFLTEGGKTVLICEAALCEDKGNACICRYHGVCGFPSYLMFL